MEDTKEELPKGRVRCCKSALSVYLINGRGRGAIRRPNGLWRLEDTPERFCYSSPALLLWETISSPTERDHPSVLNDPSLCTM